MTYKGIARAKRIELDDSVSLPDGTRVTVDIAPEGLPRRGSPAAVLRLAGTLQPAEADSILTSRIEYIESFRAFRTATLLVTLAIGTDDEDLRAVLPIV